MAEKIANFDDWKDLFYKWQKDIGFDASLVKDYKFDAIYDDGTGPNIEFGEMNYPAASCGVSKSQRLGDSQAQQAAGNMTPRDLTKTSRTLSTS